MQVLAGLTVTTKSVERIAESIGGDIAQREQADLTQTRWDEKGFAIRDPDSTTYTGAIETVAEFGKRISREALQHHWSRARSDRGRSLGMHSACNGWTRHHTRVKLSAVVYTLPANKRLIRDV
jgi:hypothetical protein